MEVAAIGPAGGREARSGVCEKRWCHPRATQISRSDGSMPTYASHPPLLLRGMPSPVTISSSPAVSNVHKACVCGGGRGRVTWRRASRSGEPHNTWRTVSCDLGALYAHIVAIQVVDGLGKPKQSLDTCMGAKRGTRG